MSRRSLLAQVHMAKKSMGLDDDLYRDWLERETGARSCRDLSDKKLQVLVKSVRSLGHLDDEEAIPRVNRPTAPQWRKCLALARDMGWGGSRKSKQLIGFVKRTAKIDHPRFLTRRGMTLVITGLEKWVKSNKKKAAEAAQGEV